jgi:hypothetical protein
VDASIITTATNNNLVTLARDCRERRREYADLVLELRCGSFASSDEGQEYNWDEDGDDDSDSDSFLMSDYFLPVVFAVVALLLMVRSRST